jgi:hypothetical protein
MTETTKGYHERITALETELAKLREEHNELKANLPALVEEAVKRQVDAALAHHTSGHHGPHLVK